VQKSYLERGPYGSIDSQLLQQVLQGVKIAVGIFE